MPLTSEDWIENKGQKLEKGRYMLMYENGQVDTDMVFVAGVAYDKDITHFIRLDPPPLPRWKPKVNEGYWLVGSGGDVEHAIWWIGRRPLADWQAGNCFPTREAAEASEHLGSGHPAWAILPQPPKGESDDKE